MDKQLYFLPLLLLIFLHISFSTGNRQSQSLQSSNGECDSLKKLFVFGDSLVDTGNGRYKKEPYGMTFPGKPDGRLSDGRILSDWIASFLGIESPIPYEKRDVANKTQLQSGMNFAVAGSGLYPTLWNNENMTVQMSHLKGLLNEKIYTQCDMSSSIALVSTSSNDYSTYLQQNGSIEEMPSVTKRVILQLSENLKILQNFGVEKVAIASMSPVGCSPQNANNNFTYPESCNQVLNSAAKAHNQALKMAVQTLNNNAKKPMFVVLDLYTSFLTAFKQHARTIDNPDYKNPTTACCRGATLMACGQVDNTGKKLYKLCKHPKLSFYFDMVHPSQHGWTLIYSALQDSLKQSL